MNLKEMIARQQALIDGAKAEGRELTAEEKAEFDRQYVENRTLFLDIKILFKTVFAVLTGKDVVEGAGKDDER